MTLTEAQVMAWLGQFLWPLFRVAAFLYALPLIGARSVPMRVRLVFAIAITVVVAPLLPPAPQVPLASLQGVLIIAQQTLIGLALGFVVQVAFQIFTVAGQFVANQNGLGFAMMVDPTNGVNVTAISQLYLISVNLLFLAMDGHLALIRFLVDSFTFMPVAETGITPDGLYKVAGLGTWLLASAVVLALPAVIALLIVNIAFGVMSKMAPQLNIISVGFPMNMVFGAFILWVTLGMSMPQLERALDHAHEVMREVATPHG